MKKLDNSLKNQVIKMSNKLADKSTKFTPIQQKIFYISLVALKNGTNRQNEVKIDKNELLDYLNLKNDTSCWTKIRTQVEALEANSMIRFLVDDEKGIWKSKHLIASNRATRDYVYIEFAEAFLPYLQELADNYVRLLDDDLISFDSKYSMMLYQNLLKDKWKLLNPDFMGIDYSTQKLKMIFGLSVEDYVNSSNNKFDRYNFEKKTINKAIKEINKKSKCINNLKVEKVKKGRKIAYYFFHFDYTDPQKTVDDFKTDKRLENVTSNPISNFDEPENFTEEEMNLSWWKNKD